jgi:hypothetical protein
MSRPVQNQGLLSVWPVPSTEHLLISRAFTSHVRFGVAMLVRYHTGAGGTSLMVFKFGDPVLRISWPFVALPGLYFAFGLSACSGNGFEGN